MTLLLNEQEQHLMDLLLALPPKLEDARLFLQQTMLSAESVGKIGAFYAEECRFNIGDSSVITKNCTSPLKNAGFPQGILSGFHSSCVYDVTKLLLDFGLDPNTIFWADEHEYYNIMDTSHIKSDYVSHYDDHYLFMFDGNSVRPYPSVMIWKYRPGEPHDTFMDVTQDDLKAIDFAVRNYLR